MTTKLFEQTETFVTEQLEKINRAAGFKTDACVLKGFLQHHVQDLIKGDKGKTFPALSVQYFKDANTLNSGSIDNKCQRTLQILGAVAVTCADDVNESLDDLLFDVKVAICNTTVKVALLDVVFELPENNDPYAMLKATVQINVTEKLENV